MPKKALFFGLICKKNSAPRLLWFLASGDPLQTRVCYFFITYY